MPKQYKDRNKRPYDKTKKKPKKFVPQEKPDYIPAVILTGGGAAAKAAAKTAEKTTEHVDGEINDKVNEKVTDKVIENVSEHVKGNDVLEQPTVDATAEKTNDTETTQDERIEENTELTEETTKDAEEETKSVEDNNAETDSAEEKTEESEDMPKSTNKEELVVEPVSENFDLDQTQDIIEEIEEAKIVAESLDADKEGTTSD